MAVGLEKPHEYPTFDQVRNSTSDRQYKSLAIPFYDGHIMCRCVIRKDIAKIDLDLWNIAWNLSESTRKTLQTWHSAYMKKEFKSSTPKGGYDCNFGKTSIRFDVRDKDADEWLRLSFDTIADKSNLLKVTPLP
jgi:hypothetical protein